MSAYDKLVDLLPTLWRPQPGDRTLVAQWLAAVGQAFDAAAVDAQHVLRAHWADTADAALWAKHYQADRRERGLPAANVRQPSDFAELQRYPWVRDLARLGALLDLPPWRDPASLRENVEEYRQRLGDVVAAYRDGLTTPDALRRLVDAALPEDMAAPLARRRSRFSIEEPVGLRLAATALVATPAVQEGDRVSPLARWRLGTGAGATGDASPPAFVFVGTAADAIGAATERPMIERYTPGASPVGVGVAWTGTLAPDAALRLAPARRTWLVRDGRLCASPVESAATEARDPSANGPWGEGTAPAGRLTALAAAPDGSLWAVGRDGGDWRVHRFDGAAFAAVETNAPAGPYLALACHGDSAWLGTDGGLFRCHLWPDDGVLRWSAMANAGGAVRALSVSAGTLCAATDDGVLRLAADGALLEHRHAGLDVFAYVANGAQELVATANAVLLLRQGRCWRYEGASVSEHLADWVEVAAPDDALQSPLPPVTALAATRDGSLWFGGRVGLARWYATEAGTTRLEAFPDLVGAVHALVADDRGLLWIAAGNGLFRYDGRDLAQHDFAAGRWIAAGRADSAYPDDLTAEPRGHWRFDRTGGRWQRWSATGRRFADADLPGRAEPSEPVAALLFRDEVRAELGQWDGSAFAPTAAVPPGELRLRIKPDETRIVDGVLPVLPPARTPADETWRYLQLDDAPVPPAEGRPWWSKEGQLFPPPERRAAVPGHYRDAPGFLADPQHEGQFDHSAFAYPPSARLWRVDTAAPAIGIRIRLHLADPDQPPDPGLAERVWNLVSRARPAGVPLQLMVEGRITKESET